MMDNIREKLVELLCDVYLKIDPVDAGWIAEELIANGVTVQTEDEKRNALNEAYDLGVDSVLHDHFGLSWRDAAELRKEVKRLQEATRWIPVTERLPCGYIVVDPSTNYKELEEYLVFCKGALFPTTAYFVDDKFVSLCETGCPSGERWCGIGEVTHWMPLSELPTPPKGE